MRRKSPARIVHAGVLEMVAGWFTMLRSVRRVIAVAGLVFAPAAMAETPDASCPHAPVSIYFASGDVDGSPEAQALLVRIGDTATRCEADTIDLIAHIDPQADGDRAVTVALERLNKVARDLIARGLPAGRIRIAARAPEPGEPVAGPNQINVVIRKSEDAAPPAPPSRLTQPVTPAFSI
ncbi:MAG TPA: hypothetical protein VFV70_00605 [Hyphomonadaceae bacterium]|nr:hypothetical protein [Hyphomonadaceae bacterium]